MAPSQARRSSIFQNLERAGLHPFSSPLLPVARTGLPIRAQSGPVRLRVLGNAQRVPATLLPKRRKPGQ
jgi:hypothetical protein